MPQLKRSVSNIISNFKKLKVSQTKKDNRFFKLPAELRDIVFSYDKNDHQRNLFKPVKLDIKERKWRKDFEDVKDDIMEYVRRMRVIKEAMEYWDEEGDEELVDMMGSCRIMFEDFTLVTDGDYQFRIFELDDHEKLGSYIQEIADEYDLNGFERDHAYMLLVQGRLAGLKVFRTDPWGHEFEYIVICSYYPEE